MHRPSMPLEISVYQDPLCAWCYVATHRLDVVRRELGDNVRWSFRSYALRLKDAAPRPKELRDWLKQMERARQEPEARGLSEELWLGIDPPRSSLPALTALEAAQMQGADARMLLMRSLQRAGLEMGLNITRADVALELAASVGLDMNRFVPAWRSEQTRRLVLQQHRLATARGVKGVPTLVIGGRWMLSGLRDVNEYREHILACLRKYGRGDEESGHALH